MANDASQVQSHGRVGVATVWNGNPSFSCALLGWCQSAKEFSRAVLAHAVPVRVTSADVLILLTSEDSEANTMHALRTIATDCHGAMVHRPEARLRAAHA